MKKHYGPPEEYFNNSEREENFISIKRLLEIGKQHLPKNLVKPLQDYPKVQTLLVGSAKTSNIAEVERFLSGIRGDAIKNDHLTLIDISPTTLKKHAEYLNNPKLSQWKQKPLRTSLVRMDMEELGIKKHSIQLILSDFTLNFAESLEGVKKRSMNSPTYSPKTALHSFLCLSFLLCVHPSYNLLPSKYRP